MIYTCGLCGERVVENKILRPSGEVPALLCPAHGVLAYTGFKPSGGSTGTRRPNFSASLMSGDYALSATSPPRWLARPPRGDSFFVGLPATANPIASGPLTINGFVDGAAWRGWLEDGVWIEEER